MNYVSINWELLRTALLSQEAITSSLMLSFLKCVLQKDWRKIGILSPVKNQGHCGSCWTFSTTGALEAAYAQAFGKGISLSEQQLVDYARAFNNFGCNGGFPSQAFEYIKYSGGLDTEDAYPYTRKNGVCTHSSKDVGVQVLDSVNITLDVNNDVLVIGYGVENVIPV
ncbi:Thiol protease aleurain-like [Abeliophyllum distichum]|uniref:Thiol protease aleurain-like n=1 Tax=Abeliophyllum distichum TaxID=126358 RepID=A0ABD1QW42_9LAMI